MKRGAVVFDLDGTITHPLLDFDAIRAELGLRGVPILEALADMPAADRAAAETVLQRHEERAAREATLRPGARETIFGLRKRGWKVAILTRNTRRSTRLVLNRFGIEVDAMRCRDDGAIKPSAEPLLALCTELNVDPAASWMVGDHLFDIQTGAAAGCHTALVVDSRVTPPYAAQAGVVLRSLGQLLSVVGEAAQ